MTQNYVSHLECSITGKKYEANQIHGLSDAGRPLLVRYNLEKLKKEVSRNDISNSKVNGLWRYAPLLPVADPENRATLGEIITPLIKLENSTKLVERMSELYPTLNSNNSIKRFLNIKIPYILINKIEDINAIIGQQQLECILSTFYLIDNPKQDKLEQIKKNNIQKCIQWCIKYKIPYNKNLYYLNSFLQL